MNLHKKLKELPFRQTQRDPHTDTSYQTVERQRRRENPESSKSDGNREIQGFFNNMNSQLLIRNHRSQEAVEEIFKVLGGENCQPRILCSAKLGFESERKMKNTKAIRWGKEKTLQPMVLGLLQRNEIGPYFTLYIYKLTQSRFKT